jgi:Fe-S cluster assembly protein SufD
MMATPAAARPPGGHYLRAISQARHDRVHEPAWLRAVRRSAADAFEHTGLPTTRHEDWRFTNVAPIAGTPFAPAPVAAVPPDEAARFVVPGLDGPLLVFVNGHHAPDLSAPGARVTGLAISTLADAIEQDPEWLNLHLGRHAAVTGRPFAALNTALFEDGALIALADDTVADLPIQVVYLSTETPAPALSFPRVLMVLGRNSQARLIETFGGVGSACGFTNAVTELVVGDGSVLECIRLQRESEAAYHIGHTRLHLGRSSRAASHAVAFGGLLARHEAEAVLAGEGADITMNGLYVAHGDRLIDNHTEIDHATPHGTSHELYKGLLGGRSRGVFNGRIRVRPDAQKTDARQTNKTLLLSDDAQVNTAPQLEIRANDVKCTHGATVGQLSEEALFYLRTRGIAPDDARHILMRAFAADVTNRVALEPVRLELDRLLAWRLDEMLKKETRS